MAEAREDAGKQIPKFNKDTFTQRELELRVRVLSEYIGKCETRIKELNERYQVTHEKSFVAGIEQQEGAMESAKELQKRYLRMNKYDFSKGFH